jgi:hypothetical protein
VAVTDNVEALYDRPKGLPASVEGSVMHRLRAEVHRRVSLNQAELAAWKQDP